MAKASEKDIQELYDFFNTLEIMSNLDFCLEDWKNEKEKNEERFYRLLKKLANKDGEFDSEKFIEYWKDSLSVRWRRVVGGLDVLINNVCDPDKSYLDYKPEILKAIEMFGESEYDEKEMIETINKTSKLGGTFKLKSGEVSNTYFDKYQFESDPKILRNIAKKMVNMIPEDTEVLAGLEMGGIPLVTMLSQLTGIPSSFIRKEQKEYGTCKYAEGADLKGKKVVIVEDVVSTGSAIIDALEKMRNDDINVIMAVCVIDRELGCKENLSKYDIELKSLFKNEQLIK